MEHQIIDNLRFWWNSVGNIVYAGDLAPLGTKPSAGNNDQIWIPFIYGTGT